jgi:hypothetical protein
MKTDQEGDRFRVEVRHRGRAPRRYTWELYGEHEAIPFEESRTDFASWEEASQAGKRTLAEYLNMRLTMKPFAKQHRPRA